MARGSSGRIVLEIDPETKDRLYVALAIRKMTLKDWFLQTATHYIDNTPAVTPYAVVAEGQTKYSVK